MRLTHRIDLTERYGERVCTFDRRYDIPDGIVYTCSSCGHLLTELSNYCRHCGARRLNKTNEVTYH